MKKILSLVLAVLMLTAVLASCGAKNGQTLDEIKESGKLIVYTEAGFAPFEFIYNNEVVGVDIAICEEIAKETGAILDIVRFSRFERGEGIEKRKDDLAAEIAAMQK